MDPLELFVNFWLFFYKRNCSSHHWFYVSISFFFSEPIGMFLYISTTLLIFSNSCHYLMREVNLSKFIYNKLMKIAVPFPLQKVTLSRNLEDYIFCVCDINRLHNAKQEILVQINKFDICIDAKGFFEINRRFVAAVILNNYILLN